MIKKSIFLITALTCTLTACNTAHIDPANPPVTPNYDAKHDLIVVYQNRADIPKGGKIVGNVASLNKLPDGSKASPQAIMVELKKQAWLLGGNGIVNITPGIAQTTADVVVVR